MMSMINPNADTPMIKMMMSEKITTKVDAVFSATLIEEQPVSTAMDIAPTQTISVLSGRIGCLILHPCHPTAFLIIAIFYVTGLLME